MHVVSLPTQVPMAWKQRSQVENFGCILKAQTSCNIAKEIEDLKACNLVQQRQDSGQSRWS